MTSRIYRNVPESARIAAFASLTLRHLAETLASAGLAKDGAFDNETFAIRPYRPLDARPNFLHKPTGAMVRWCERIGQGMWVDLNGADWRKVADDCLRSIRGDRTTRAKT